MILGRRVAVFVLTLGLAGGLGADVVVLKGGAVINLKKPPERRGDTVLLTRTDGALLSVPASEIDREATSAARSTAAAPPAPAADPAPAATLAGAARASREGPKARVRITDADVSHGEAAQSASDVAAEEAESAADAAAGAGRVEVAEYTQEKSGDGLVVRGTLKNPGSTPALNVRMTVTAIDPKGETITSGDAGVSNGTIEPLRTVAFSVTIPIGARAVGSLRFSPRWVSPSPPSAAPASDSGSAGRAASPPADSAIAAPAAPPQPSAPPPPAPTPYGRGSLYAAPPASAPSQPPADGKTGYIPGAADPSNQPKPPS
jgi:hypothetical protein